MSGNNPHTVCATFTFKDVESKEKFIEFCNGENGLSVTRAWKGCQLLDCYESHDNPNKVVIWQKWASKEDQQSYIKHRHEDGSFEFLHSLIASPPEINPLSPLVFKSDREQVEDVVKDMCNKDHNVGKKHMTEDCVFIRPTGNPLNMKGWDEMMNNKDVVVESNELVKVNKLHVSGNMAYVCYTTHGKFSYKGTENDDVAVLSSVLEKRDGRWRVVHGQRSSGRKPTDSPPAISRKLKK